MATSTYCPSPLRSRSYSAAKIALHAIIPLVMSMNGVPAMTAGPLGWPLIDMKPLSEYRFGQSIPEGFVFSPDGRRVLTRIEGDKAYIWDYERSRTVAPPLAGVGLTERQARAEGLDVVVATTDLQELARSSTDGSAGGRLILVADRERGVLVGAGAIGACADDWISEASVSIRAQVPVRVLADVVHPFPTNAQAYEVPLRELARQLP